VVVLLVCSLFLLGADNSDQAIAERSVLAEQELELNARVDSLRSEQDRLQFQKAMYAVDSKYLVLNISARTGQLLYKNRVLKDFRFTPSKNFNAEQLKPGVLVITKKTEAKNDRHALRFGKSLIIQWRRKTVPPQEADIPFISLTKKDLLSVFFAVEEGAMAYVVR